LALIDLLKHSGATENTNPSASDLKNDDEYYMSLTSEEDDLLSIPAAIHSTINDKVTSTRLSYFAQNNLVTTESCPIHNKPIEAICWTDMKPICIDCILGSSEDN
jgi:hypothetical protein